MAADTRGLVKHLVILGLLSAGLFVFNSARGQATSVNVASPEQLAVSEKTRAWGDWPKWGDAGNGTYNNPVLPADYSDLDCIRVGADYYAISSTFQFSPGVIILHSKDLVNWTIAGHAVPDITQIGPEMNWDRMNRYGKGIWAGAIRYHDQKFWIYFGTPDEGYFMTTAPNVAGPWAPLHKVLSEGAWDDCCPFWDDDGQGYFVGTKFKAGYQTSLFRLTPDGRDIIPTKSGLISLKSGLISLKRRLLSRSAANHPFAEILALQSTLYPLFKSQAP